MEIESPKEFRKERKYVWRKRDSYTGFGWV